MAIATTTQLNVRMDSQLRAAGDAMLERVGVTPAQIVRALWAKVAGSAQECEEVLSFLAEETTPQTSSRGEECLASIESWHTRLFSLANVDRESYVAPSDDELDEMLYDEWLRCDAEEADS